MKSRLFVRDQDGNKTLLVETNLEVVPRGIYVVDGVPYQYVGQPTFHINKYEPHPMSRVVGSTLTHVLESVDIVVEKL